MNARSTVFLTTRESQRVGQNFKLGVEQRQARAGEPWKAENRQGLIQHATSTSLMQEMSLGLGGAAPKSDDSMMTYAIGAAYPPCMANAQDLEPMGLPDLRLESHHRGRKLTVRRVSPVAELNTSSWTVVEAVGQDADHVVVVEMYLHKKRLGEDLLETAFEFVIKEPFYTLNGNDEPVIRINHPSDLVITAFSEDAECWRDNYKVANPAVTPEQCKDKGNQALVEQQYSLAHAYYTRGIAAADAAAAAGVDPSSTLPRDIRRNRAHVNLLLKRYDEAIADAFASLTNGASSGQQLLDAKAYFRAGTAAYALCDFNRAKRCFEEQDRLQPGVKTTQVNIRRSAKRLEEQANGNHNMTKILATVLRTRGAPDVASFNGDTVVQDSPKGGSGLFATRDFEAGEIIMCEKAFCVVSSADDDAAVTALTVDLDQDYTIRVFPAGLHRAVVQKLLDNPSQAPKILSLDGGGYVGVGAAGASNGDGPVVDTFHVHHVVQRNAFGLSAQSGGEDVSNASTGLWVRASRLNHSCTANSSKEFFGDLLVLRAAKPIRAGDEITHAYDEHGDYPARKETLQKTWGFRCRCPLCRAEAKDGEMIWGMRREMIRESSMFVNANNPSSGGVAAVIRAKRLKRALDNSYDEQRFKNLPRLATKLIDEWLAMSRQFRNA